MIKLTDQEIQTGLDEAFVKAGDNAYFGNGFRMGVSLYESKNIVVKDIEKRIDNLISDYESKIEDYDLAIDAHTKEIREIRKGAPEVLYTIEELTYERKIIEGKRQLLFQATKDLGSLEN
tara:strand:+ start:500 stop:859 length:360 start_codon:yes stop_codon:yes gene_type:complete